MLPVPADLEARVISFVALVEAGEKTHAALTACNLTPEQAGLVLARRPELQKRKESVRTALVEKRKVMVESVEDRVFQQVMGDEEVETTEEEGVDKDGNAVSKKKTRRRTVSHDNLAIQILGLDAEHRKVKQGDAGGGSQVVSLNVQFNGIDFAAFKRGNSEAVRNMTIDVVEDGLKQERSDAEDADVVSQGE